MVVEDLDLEEENEKVAIRRKEGGGRRKKTTEKDDVQVLDIEEEIEIDLEDPEVDAAALKIQSSFKGRKARAEVSQMRKERRAEPQKTTMLAPNMNQGGGGSSVIENCNKMMSKGKEKEAIDDIDIDMEDPEVDAAALKIQASFKGKKARTEVAQLKKEKAETQLVGEKLEEKKDKMGNEDVIDIDLTDPEVDAAALKIQSSFKGKKARDQVAEMRKSKADEKENVRKEEREEEIDIDLDDPDVDAAALKIQSSFKGKKARDEVAAMRAAKAKKEAEQHILNEKDEIDPNNADVVAARMEETFTTRDIVGDFVDEENALMDAAAKNIEAKYKKGLDGKGVLATFVDEEDAIVDAAGRGKSKESGISGNLVDEEIKVVKKIADNGNEKEEAWTVAEDLLGDLVDEENAIINAAAAKIEANADIQKDQLRNKDDIVGKLVDEEKDVIDGASARIEVNAIKANEDDIIGDLVDEENAIVDAAAQKIEDTFKAKTDIVGEMVDQENLEMMVDQENAAIKIQAGVRGSKARKEVKEMKQLEEEKEEAVVKIQSGYRGAKDRERVARMKEEKKMVSSVLREVSHEMEEEMRREEEEEDGEINWDDAVIEDGATNLQAGYRQQYSFCYKIAFLFQ